MSNDTRIVSLSGSPILQHDEPAPWQPAQGEECLEAISDHIGEHLGPVDTVLHEIVSDTVHIDVHVVLPSESFPFLRLVTSGMSDLPMRIPDGIDAPAHLELQMTLPADWPLAQELLQDERNYWPIRLLKSLARFPHKYATWLGWGHSMPNGDPALPYADNTRLCGALLLPPVTVPDAFRSLRINDDKTIEFLAVVPLYEGEMNLKLREGTEALTRRFDKHGISDIIDITRRDVSHRRFWFF
jgi:hypothetical protein